MGISLADPFAGEDLAAESIAIGEPSTFEQNFSAAWNASRLNDRFIGERSALEEEYDAHNDQVFKRTGNRLPNPIRLELPPGVNRSEWTGDPRIPLPVEKAIDLYREFAGKNGDQTPSAKDFQSRAHAKMRGAEARREQTGERGTGAAAGLGQFLGTASAIATDPPVLASMLFGGPASSTVLRAMAREALIAGATETAIQPQIQSARLRAGLPGGVVQGAQNIAMAAGGAGLLTGLFRGGVAGYRSLRGKAMEFAPATAADADAARYTERFSDLQGSNPLAETSRGAVEHVERLSAAQERLYDLEGGPRLTDEPAVPARPLTRSDLPAPDLDNPTQGQLSRVVAGQPAEREFLAPEQLEALARRQEIADELLQGGALEDYTLDLTRTAAPKPPRDDPSLVDFIMSKGGINDSDRALASIGISPRNRPGLIKRSGLSASQMSELAAEAGYFPPAAAGEGSRVVDQRELATAILDELGGQKLYSRHGPLGNVTARLEYEETIRQRSDVLQALEDLGLDPKKMSNQEIRDTVTGMLEQQAGRGATRPDLTAEFIENTRRTADELDAQADMEERLAIMAENNFREDFAGRMDEPIFIQVGDEFRSVSARDIFQSLTDEDRLVDEFTKCVHGVPF